MIVDNYEVDNVEEDPTFELNEDELNDALSKLNKGESVTIGNTTYLNPPISIVCDDHIFEFTNMEDEFHAACKCKNCINGRIYDTRTHQIKDGQIVKL